MQARGYVRSYRLLHQNSLMIRDDDDVYYYIRWRLKLKGDDDDVKGETENMGVW